MTTLTVRPEASSTITVNDPIVIEPETRIYAEGFETGLGGWSRVTGQGANREDPSVGYETPAKTGTYAYVVTGTASSPYQALNTRTVTGLEVGRSYTLRAYSNRPTATAGTNGARIGVTGIGASAYLSTAKSWLGHVFVFTATATSHELRLELHSTSGNTVLWDSVTLDKSAVTSTTVKLPISQGKVRLDENYSPYVTANFTVPLTSLELLEQIDPRTPQRVTVKASSTGHNDRVYSAWAEQRRNLVGNPTPATTTGWSGPYPGTVTADGYTVTNTATTTPYIFSTTSTESIVAGRVYAFRAKVKATPAAGSVFTNVNVRPHKNVGNVYYNMATPVMVPANGVEQEVAFYWTATANIPASDAFNLSIVGNGTGLTGSKYSMRDVLIEDVGTVVPSAPPAEYFAPATSGELQQTRFIGTTNASASVLETRAITGSVWVPEDERTFNLGLRSRTVDHGAGTVDIELASDEILLHDRKHVATTADSTARQYETSLRAVCSWALGKVGATLAPGTADADMTAAWDATNLQTNPTAGQNTTGWVGSGGTVTRINTGTWPEGTGIGSAVRVTMTAGATGGPYFEGGDSASVAGGSLNVSIREKQLYRVTAWVRTSVSKSIRLSVQQRNSAGALAGTNRSGPAFTTTANTWHRLTFVVQAYPGASRMGVYAYLASGTYAAGQTVDITGVTITEGTLDHTYFDGGTNVRTDLYAYSWNDAAHLSTSERRAHVVRRPELFDWTPGQSLFDFLQPLINASGLRLFCDETRTWRLVDPAEYEVPGYVVAQTGHNATEGTDSITRNDDTWADAVVVKYVWTDANGETKSQYDIAGDPNGKTITREIEREYPGPGAAAAILASYEGRGRTQSVTVVGQYLATPGMDVTVNLPGTLTQTGKVRAVELDLGSGLNRVETRGLTDALAGSWILWDPDQTWAEVDPGLLWKDA